MTGKLRITLIMLSAFLCASTASAQRPANGSFPDHFRTGTELFDAGSYRAAQAELAKALESLDSDRMEDAALAEYMLAMCAAKLGEPGAKDLLTAYISKYPGSGHINEIRFAMANQYFDTGDYANALEEYEPMVHYLSTFSQAERNEYYFKYAYSTFMLRDRLGADAVRNAYHDFTQVREGEYYVHARYYIAYIDYSDGNLTAAKRGFSELQHIGGSGSRNPYADLIPFYLLQIEFSEGNYDYVIANGEQLMRSSTGYRATEIARILAESWFYTDDYSRTLQYTYTYCHSRGDTGRSEHYLVGYSPYVRHDIGPAMPPHEKSPVPDDSPTQ